MDQQQTSQQMASRDEWLRLDLDEVRAALKGDVLVDEPLSKHTSFGIGGPADFFFRPKTEEDIRWIVTWARTSKVPVKALGNGTNLLVSDKGVRGGVIRLTPAFGDVSVKGDILIAGAGAKLARVIEKAADAGLSGLEATVGVPGTIGGAIVTNAGTDVGSVGDLVQEISVMDDRGHVFTLHHDDLQYAYRYSNLMGSGLIVLTVRLALTPAHPVDIRAKMERLRVKRATRQPLRARSAGSVFKNPPTIAAGKLLDRAGAKGMRCGDAQVSYKHANFIINKGKATASDLRALVERLQELCLRVHGIWLEPEIEFVGDW